MLDPDRVRGLLLGLALGDALAMPVDKFSHQNVRLFYRGIKELRADEKRGGLDAGQWTFLTQHAHALAATLASSEADGTALAHGTDDVPARYAAALVALSPDARRRDDATAQAVERLAAGVAPAQAGDTDAAMGTLAPPASVLGVWWAATDADTATAHAVIAQTLGVTHRHPATLAVAVGQAAAVRRALTSAPDTLDAATFLDYVHAATAEAEVAFGADHAVSNRLRALAPHLDEYPLDLQDRCNGTGTAADEAWPFAVAMVARGPAILEATLLSAINVGGATGLIGATAGALLGALHGAAALPAAWHDGLEAAADLTATADRLTAALG